MKATTDGFYTPAGLAALLDVPKATLQGWRYRREGPPYYKVGGLVRYAKRDVDAWLASCREVR